MIQAGKLLQLKEDRFLIFAGLLFSQPQLMVCFTSTAAGEELEISSRDKGPLFCTHHPRVSAEETLPEGPGDSQASSEGAALLAALHPRREPHSSQPSSAPRACEHRLQQTHHRNAAGRPKFTRVRIQRSHPRDSLPFQAEMEQWEWISRCKARTGVLGTSAGETQPQGNPDPLTAVYPCLCSEWTAPK